MDWLIQDTQLLILEHPFECAVICAFRCWRRSPYNGGCSDAQWRSSHGSRPRSFVSLRFAVAGFVAGPGNRL